MIASHKESVYQHGSSTTDLDLPFCRANFLHPASNSIKKNMKEKKNVQIVSCTKTLDLQPIHDSCRINVMSCINDVAKHVK